MTMIHGETHAPQLDIRLSKESPESQQSPCGSISRYRLDLRHESLAALSLISCSHFCPS